VGAKSLVSEARANDEDTSGLGVNQDFSGTISWKDVWRLDMAIQSKINMKNTLWLFNIPLSAYDTLR